ncbi:MAG: carbohydrate ABC transporter permease [Lachnospiraceae bacterium]|nr:carbohydrate ABC transporter permease [Lachnospiraceae bacterium]
MSRKKKNYKYRFQWPDLVILIILSLAALIIILPFVNVIAISLTTQKAYADTPLLLFPKVFTWENYQTLLDDGRIMIGYKTSSLLLIMALPINMMLTTMMAYGLSRKGYPGREFILKFVVFTMLFNGGIVPLYLTVKSYGLIGSLWSVALCEGLNTFYMIIVLNFFQSLPESLIESAKLDGAGEFKIMCSIVLPLSKPALATIFLYYLVDRWNEWYYAMLMVRDTKRTPLQLVLRNIVLESQNLDNIVTESVELFTFSAGIKMGAVVVTVIPVMCVYPFLQKYFTKGIMIGAVK